MSRSAMAASGTQVRIGERIKRARVHAGLTPEELAVALGVSSATMYRIERGTSGVKVDRLEAIAETTGKTLGYFLDGVAA